MRLQRIMDVLRVMYTSPLRRAVKKWVVVQLSKHLPLLQQWGLLCIVQHWVHAFWGPQWYLWLERVVELFRIMRSSALQHALQTRVRVQLSRHPLLL